jgi:hypothetical protein
MALTWRDQRKPPPTTSYSHAPTRARSAIAESSAACDAETWANERRSAVIASARSRARCAAVSRERTKSPTSSATTAPANATPMSSPWDTSTNRSVELMQTFHDRPHIVSVEIDANWDCVPGDASDAKSSDSTSADSISPFVVSSRHAKALEVSIGM